MNLVLEVSEMDATKLLTFDTHDSNRLKKRFHWFDRIAQSEGQLFT